MTQQEVEQFLKTRPEVPDDLFIDARKLPDGRCVIPRREAERALQAAKGSLIKITDSVGQEFIGRPVDGGNGLANLQIWGQIIDVEESVQ